MILTAHQPTFLPWAGLFHKIAMADVFVFFDGVQFEYHEWGNRNRIMTHQGELMITVPVEKTGHMSKVWTDMKIADKRWIRKMIRTLQLNYAKASFTREYLPRLEEILQREHEYLADLTIDLIQWAMNALGLQRPTYRASRLELTGKGSDLVLDMCLKLGASEYIFGAFGKDYADVAKFETAGVKVRFQEFTPPVYQQVHRQFVPGLSIIDLLFNQGPESLKIIMKE